MKRHFVLGIVVLCLLWSVTTNVAAQVVLTDDAFTWSQTPKANYGNQIALVVCSGTNAYLKFSFAGLPSGLYGTNISGASVVLYADAVLTSGTMDVYAISSSWSEGSITYNNAPALGNKLLSAVSVTKTGYLSLNLTSTVQAWLNGTLTNNGIALVPSSGSQISVSFDSKENILTGHTAELSLVLVSAGAQGPQGPQGAAGPQGPIGATGATGAAGPAGAQGPLGAMGAQGLQGLMGLPGATGAAGPQGPAGANGTGFNFRNAFDNSASYAVNDVVAFQGTSYVAIATNQGPNNPTPDQNPAAWSLMAQAGAAGAQGAQGLSGPPGPTGAIGPQGVPGPAGTQGPSGTAGPAGPQGPQGPAGSGGGGFNGMQVFTTTGTFTVPNGITHLLVEMWGAGGGGGGIAVPGYGSGGGGGGGGYTRSVVPVAAGVAYNIAIGAGGAGASGSSQGDTGGATQITDSSSNVLATAPGGSGGGPGLGNFGGDGGLGGVGGAGANSIGSNGSTGGRGTTDTVHYATPGGVGGLPALSWIVPTGLGVGGVGGTNGPGNPGSQPGTDGYAVITW